jgi:hypothetical protein
MSNAPNNTATGGQGTSDQSGTGQGGQTGGGGGPFGGGPYGGGPFGGGPFGGGPFGGGNMFADPMQMMMMMAALQQARQAPPAQPMAAPLACLSSMMPWGWTGFPWAWMIWWAWWWSWLVWPGFLPGGGALPPMPGGGGMPNLMGQFAATRADFWYHLFEAMKSIWQQAANSTGLAGFPFTPDGKPMERTDPDKLRAALKDFPEEQRARIVHAVQCAEMMMSMFQFPRR